MLDLNGTWYFHLVSPLLTFILLDRLLEYAANYFDLSSFPDGESKRALQRIVNKKAGKAPSRHEGTNGEGNPKKRKKT
jgi:hypothetical protein